MNNQILEIRLSPKGIKPVRNGHPWVFRNALAGTPRPASVSAHVVRTVLGNGIVWGSVQPAIVCDAAGSPLGWGIYNEASRLALRMITRNPAMVIHKGLFVERIRDSCSRRGHLRDCGDTTAYRLVFGEADGFPGLVADRLGETIVVEVSGAFAWQNRFWIAEELRRHGGTSGVRIIPDREMLSREGVSLEAEPEPEPTPEPHPAEGATPAEVLRENGLPWCFDGSGGQKTGFYCDQRENRRLVARLAGGCSVLDAFCYHGGFGLMALHHGAHHVTFADSSRAALALVEQNCSLQEVSPGSMETIRGDLLAMIRNNSVGTGGLDRFDLVVLGPPKLVPARHHRDAGFRAYKDLNLAAMRFMKGGSRLVTFSCSGAVSRDEFRTVLAWAAADSGRVVRIEGVLSQGEDHPVPLHFPDAEYLKGFILRIE